MWPSLMSVLAFLIPVSSAIEFELVGRLFVSDLLCLAIFPILLFTKGEILRISFARTFIWLGLLYLLGQFTTDLILNTAFFDYSRGLAKIAITIISFCTIFMIIGLCRSRMLIFIFGVITGGILHFFFSSAIYTKVDIWKFGIGTHLTFLIIIFAALLKNKKNVILKAKHLLPFLAGFLNLYLGFRSLAGICFLSLSYLILQEILHDHIGKNVKPTTRKVVLMAIGLFIAAIMIVKFYEFSANAGWLGWKQQQKYEAQAHGQLGLVFGGRSQVLVALRAIMESPFIGHGSWAKDWEYAQMLVDLRNQLGYRAVRIHELGLIPSHSHFFGSWVEAGIIGAIFWGWILSLAIRACLRLFNSIDPHTLLLIFIAFQMTWDVLFSPFGATRRLMIPFYIIVMINVMMRYPSKSKEN